MSLATMQTIARRLWPRARRWTTGELAWSFVTDHPSGSILLDDGFGWDADGEVCLVGVDGAVCSKLLDWSDGRPVQALTSDTALIDEAVGRGWSLDECEPFLVHLEADAGHAGLSWPTGYRIRSARPDDDLLDVHRRAWKPSRLPFGDGPHGPEGAESPFDAADLAAVQATPTYRLEHHVVAEAPDGSLAGSALLWIDEVVGVASIEPLGVVPEHRGRGLASALAGHCRSLAQSGWCSTVVVHPRGDDGYPVPLQVYRRAGFSARWRSVVLRPSADL